MAERWLPVVGLDGFYEVSDQGRVRSLRFRNKQTNRLRESPLILSQWAAAGGDYWAVTLRQDQISIHRLVHHLVLEAFVGPRPPDHETAHGPKGPGCNWLHNIRWATSKENTADIIAAGNFQMGERHYAARLTVEKVRQIKRLKGIQRPREIAETFGVSTSAIKSILNGYNWKHIDV